jgi:hypothetical protein
VSEPASLWSPTARVLLRPATTYRRLLASDPGRRPLLRGLALLLFVIGCAVSAFASGRFTVRLIADGAVSFAFVPAFELGALAVVFRMSARPPVPLARSASLFLVGNAPWLFWLTALGALGWLVPPSAIGPWVVPIETASVVPAAWSAVIDFHFFREVFGRPARHAVRDVVVHRAVGWACALAYFFGIAVRAEILPELLRWAGR